MTVEHAYACDGSAEAHVVWDWRTQRFHAEKRCECRALCIVSRRRHESFFPADDEAEALPYPTTGEKPRLRNRTAIVMPPTPIEVHNAWIAWWVAFSAQHGYESRLRTQGPRNE